MMPKSRFSQFHQPQESEPEQPSNVDPEQWIEMLSRSDRSSYNMMAIEVWSIAKTMDALFPGFWSRFMSNRQVALKQFLQHKQERHAAKRKPPTEL